MTQLITDHMLPSDLVELSVSNMADAQRNINLLYAHRPDSALELLLLGYADWMGCGITDAVRGDREQRVKLAHGWLAEWAERQSSP